ncbi:MAG TPA: allophanate hydrolase [Xanthobacteraceae bacterium]|nr:allophanate hydrolase [Xanthobacteraceae bacterium]
MPRTAADIAARHQAEPAAVEATVGECYRRIREYNDPAIFIALKEEREALNEAKALAKGGGKGLPLFGVPVAVKDNIDAQEFPTTAACPPFAYQPKKDAHAVARLRQAGAIIIGKTNLDQFATGLVGVRSPYGIPRNTFKRALIPGGSSSGSAVAVAAGLVPLALGTDTAGSGRVPAGMNNIVGLKPSLGLVSTSGVVPACRSLDCVSVFALTVDDALAALRAIAGEDASDPFSKTFELAPSANMPARLSIGVPRAEDRHFFGDKEARSAFERSIDELANIGAAALSLDISPLLEAARLLYEGPWVAERFAAVGEFIEKHREDCDPTVREIILGGAKASAVDAFRAFYRLQALRRQSRGIFSNIDALMVPTNPVSYSIADIKKEPVKFNSHLGTYTNFANLLDLAGIAVPASISAGGTPYGVTFLGPSGQDVQLANIGRVFHAMTNLKSGAPAASSPR